MSRWTQWGAGPASAGARGPSRVFLVIALAGTAVATGLLAREGRWGAAAVAAAGAVYFALRAFAGLGRRA